ncbi:hypothetical protein LINPERHAP2_LOCUS29196 [Linum perenne]
MYLNWGVQASANIWSLEDDVWLLECESLEAVRRVIALNRCVFGSVRIFLDSWTAGAGRSSCLEELGLAWVLVKAITSQVDRVILKPQRFVWWVY